MEHKGETHAIRHNRFDREDLMKAVGDTPGFRSARRRINTTTTTGSQAVDDLFYLLFKVDPHLLSPGEMAPEYLVNRAVADEMTQLQDLQRLRDLTWGDAFQSAVSCMDLMPRLEAVFDRLEQAQKLADQLAELLRQLPAAQALVTEAEALLDELSGSMTDEDLDQALRVARDLSRARLDLAGLRELIDATRAKLEAELDEASPEVAVGLSTAFGQVAERTAQGQEVASAWGMQRGELQRLSAAERFELARALKSDKMRRIADLFGRIRNLSLSMACEVTDVHEEIVDLELGDDLGRVVPAELLALAHPETETEFLARWADSELTQYAVRGTDELGRGAIVLAIDGTGSMSLGDRDLWAKAVMLVLLHQAKAQRRAMHVIVFGYRQFLHIPFTKPSDFTPHNLVRAAEAFFNSGTDFVPPMREALRLLQAEHAATGRATADVVFITDDECVVPHSEMQHYLSEMRRMRARTWGVAVDSHVRPDGPLAQMSEGRLLMVEDLASGRDITELLAAMR